MDRGRQIYRYLDSIDIQRDRFAAPLFVLNIAAKYFAKYFLTHKMTQLNTEREKRKREREREREGRERRERVCVCV